MDHCTIYCHPIIYSELVEIIDSRLKDAKVSYSEKEGFKRIDIKLKSTLFKKGKELKISYRERKNPSYQLGNIDCPLTQNLAGMVEFVTSIKAQNTEIHDLLLQKIETINCEISFSGIPNYSPEMQAILMDLCNKYEPIIFAAPNKFFGQSKNQHFLNKELKLILDTRGSSKITELDITIDANYYDETRKVSASEKRRKEASEALLKAKGVKINKHLPTINEKVSIRPKQSIVNRAYALATIAAKGEGVPKEQLDNVIERLHITEFSEKEVALLNATVLSDQEKSNATWRYESLNVMLWALSKTDTLVYPSTICDVEKIVGIMLKDNRETFEQHLKVRSRDEVLDQLDLIYRMNWSCVDARLNGNQPDGELMGSVIYERHYALNWLTHYQDQKWDDISTDT